MKRRFNQKKIGKKMLLKEDILKTIKEAKVSVRQIDGLEEFNDDTEIAEALLERSGSYLEYLSDRLKDNDTFVLKAIQRYGRSLKFASQRLQADKNLIKVAIFDTILVLEYLPNDILNLFTKDEILTFVEHSPDIYKQLPYNYMLDMEIATTALSLKTTLYPYMPDKIREDKDLAIVAVSKASQNYKYVSENLKNDKEILSTVKNASSLDTLEYDYKELIDNNRNLILTISHTYTGTFTKKCTVEIPATQYKDVINNPKSFFDEENAVVLYEDIKEDSYEIEFAEIDFLSELKSVN